MASATFEQLLADRIGLEAAALGPDAVASAIRRRMAQLDLATEAEYRRYLQASPEEWQVLLELVAVPETWFFRDPAAFDFLAQGFAGPGPLRILSAPCSTGEEPYSIAIALLEAGRPPGSYQIDAADLCAAFLARAEAGVYGANSFRGSPLDRHPRYFAADRNHGTVRSEVRAGIRFMQANLMAPDFLQHEAPYDIVFCRNLLIYQHAAARQLMADTLERCLKPGGLLFVGHAEMLPLFDRRYAMVRRAGVFAYHKKLRHLEPPAPRSAASAGPAQRKPAAAQAQIHPPPPVAPAAPKPLTLDHARKLADEGRLDEASAVCEKLLQQNRPAAGIYLLLGLIHSAGGRLQDAEEAMNRALYLDANLYEALVHLALFREKQGDASGAEHLRQRARRAQEHQEVSA